MKSERKFWMTIVNLITFTRILGSIILFYMYFKFGPKSVAYLLAFLFSTDWVDGYLARKHNVSTFFGSILDSISDKLMAITSCIILCFINKYMLYSIIIEVLIVIVNTMVFTQKGNIKSSYIGKVKTCILSLAIIVGFFICKENKDTINLCVAAPAIIAQLITLIDYIIKSFKVKFRFTKEAPKYKSFNEITKMLFSPEFYEQNKNKTGLINNIYDNGK